MIYVGTSGWQYDDWRGAFYPPELAKVRWLKFYAERFATVELNNSFYRLPSLQNFERWRAATPAGFVVAVKASRFITHVRRLRDPAEPIALLWARAAGLGSRLGPVLFQLPPHFGENLELLEGCLAAIPSGMRAAFEFRDPSWDREDVRRALDRAGAALVLADRPGARVRGKVTGGWSYVRFHQGSESGSGYVRTKLSRWAARLAELPADDVFVYFNNDEEAAAPTDASILREILAEKGALVAPVPGTQSPGVWGEDGAEQVPIDNAGRP